jgi:hypothetical protein
MDATDPAGRPRGIGRSGRLATKRVAKAGDLVAWRLRPGRYVLRIPGRGPTTAFVLR